MKEKEKHSHSQIPSHENLVVNGYQPQKSNETMHSGIPSPTAQSKAPQTPPGKE